MAFTVDGSLIQATSSTFTLVPGHTGELIMIAVTQISNGTVTATALSSSNATWTLQRTFKASGAHQVGTTAIFTGVATSTSSQTVTVTWSGATPATIRIVGRAFTTTTGAWAVTSGADLDSAGTNTWPSLTAPVAGCLYWGFVTDSGTATAGSTAGWVYEVDAHSNGEAYNQNCLAASVAPVWGDSTQQMGSVVMVKETNLLLAATAKAATTDAFGNTVNYGLTLAEGCGPFLPGETWHTVSLATGLTGTLAGAVGCRVKKLPNNMVAVEVECNVTNTTTTFNIGSLPDASYYPQATRHLPVVDTSAATCRLFIPTTGGLQLILSAASSGTSIGASAQYALD
jgi:hypothetical protein